MSTRKVVRPCWDRILIKRFEAVKEQGGIIVPDHSQEAPAEGTIMAMGPGVPTLEKFRLEEHAFWHPPSGFYVETEGEREKRAQKVAAQAVLDANYTQHFELGQHVIFAKYAGHPITIDEETYYVLKMDEIISVIVDVPVVEPVNE